MAPQILPHSSLSVQCKLACIRHWSNCNVAHDYYSILAILRLVGDEKHRSADTADARSTFNDLQGWTQGVASCAQRTADLSVGTFRLDYHTAKVEWILHQFTSFLNGHTLLLAEFSQQGCIFLRLGVVLRVDECGLVDVCQAPLLCQRVNLVWIANEDKVRHTVSQHSVGCP